jgi:uncharacterized DUF497 family protein
MGDSVRFTWDPAKARSNLAKHGVSFDEASEVLTEPDTEFYADMIHPERCIAIGHSRDQRLLIVVHIDMTDTVRIISARKATSKERKKHEKG